MLTNFGKAYLLTAIACILMSLAFYSMVEFNNIMKSIGVDLTTFAPGISTMTNFSIPFLMFGTLMLTSFLIMYVHAKAFMENPKLKIERKIIPSRCFAGDYILVSVRITNLGRARLDCVIISDLVPDAFEISFGENFIMTSLPPKKTVEFSYILRSLVRGEYKIGPIVAIIRDSAGFFLVREQIDIFSEVVVYPLYEPVRRYLLLKKIQGGFLFGTHKIKQKGFGYDFWGLREFLPSDPIKLIDWKASARLGKLLVKEFEAEKNIKLYIVVDCSRNMGGGFRFRTKLDYAIDGALLLAHLAFRSRDLFGLVLFSDRIHRFIKAKRSRSHLLEVIDALARARASGLSSLMTAFQAIIKRDKRYSLAIVITDLEADPETIEEAIKYAVAHKLHVIIIACLTPLFVSDPAKMTDVERAFFEALYRDYLRKRVEIKQRINKYGVMVFDVRPTDIIPAVLEAYIRAKHIGLGAM